MSGALQTRGTCWFYSILNGFILSEDGQKILFVKLKEFYEGLTAAERAYFDSSINAPCPQRNLTKTKEIYFWKFIDQYLCFMSGPRSLSLKAGKSANLLGGVQPKAAPQAELARILDHVGFKGDYSVRYATEPPKMLMGKKPQFIVLMQKRDSKEYLPQVSVAGPDARYRLVCASILIANSTANEEHSAHAVAGYIANSKGYIFDSNQRKTFRCDWWDTRALVQALPEIVKKYKSLRNGQVDTLSYGYAIYAYKQFANSIAPTCLRRYKSVKTPKLNYADPNLLKRLNARIYKPAEIAAIKKRWAQTKHRSPVVIGRNTYDSIVNSAPSFSAGVRTLRNLENAGYRSNNYNYFVRKLRTKFPVRS